MKRNCDNCQLKNVCEKLDSGTFKEELIDSGLWIMSVNYCDEHIDSDYGISIDEEVRDFEDLENRVNKLEDDLEFKAGEVSRLEDLLDENDIEY